MATYYLNADSGDNDNAGTSASPWLTLAYAITNSAAGDTIYCQNSTATYAFLTQAITNRTIEGESATGVVFDGGATNAVWTNASGTASIKYLTIQNISSPTSNSSTINLTGVNSFTATGIIFKNILSTVAQSVGLVAGGGLVDATFIGCIFDDLQFSTASNLYHGGFFAHTSVNPTDTIRVYNCVFYIKTSEGVMVKEIFHCRGSYWNVDIKNTIFLNSSGVSRYICDWYSGPPTNQPLTVYNTCYSGLFTLYRTTAYTLTGANNFTDDPQFIDAPNSDFRLRPTSLCIDAGTII